MNFEFNEISHRLYSATVLIDSARYHFELWIESRVRARQIWNDSCNRDMESIFFTPLLRNWEMADQCARNATEGLQGVLAQFNLFQQSAENHARAAASVSASEEEFKSLCSHLESLRDSIHHPFRECARLKDEADDLLKEAEDICSQAGI
jgi:hypothetical protein